MQRHQHPRLAKAAATTTRTKATKSVLLLSWVEVRLLLHLPPTASQQHRPRKRRNEARAALSFSRDGIRCSIDCCKSSRYNRSPLLYHITINLNVHCLLACFPNPLSYCPSAFLAFTTDSTMAMPYGQRLQEKTRKLPCPQQIQRGSSGKQLVYALAAISGVWRYCINQSLCCLTLRCFDLASIDRFVHSFIRSFRSWDHGSRFNGNK